MPFDAVRTVIDSAGRGSPRKGWSVPRRRVQAAAARRSLGWQVKVAGLLTILTCGACTPGESVSDPNIILLALDTFRADRLGPSSSRATLTPELDALAGRARVYSAATAAAPLTMPSMTAVMTGRYPDRAGIIGHSFADRLDHQVATLGTLADQAGYVTVAVVTNPWLARRALGFARGFDAFASGRTLGADGARVDAETVTETALAAATDHASSSTGPLLLWAHYMDTHMPYPSAASPLASGAPAVPTTPVIEDFSAPGADRQRIYFEAPYDDEELEATRTLYDAAVRTVDTAVGRLLDGLERLGLLENAVVVVLSDHGEALGEHGLYFAHDFNVYEELVGAVLMVSAPGLAPGRDERPVSLVDVLPTVCALSSLDCPDDLDGRNLAVSADEEPLVFTASAPRRERYDRAPWITVDGPEGRLTAVRRGALKIIRTPTPEGVRWEAYNLAVDPEESRNLYDESEHAGMREALERWVDQMSEAREARAEDHPAERSPGRRTLRELRSLGYVD